jgi:hypothetical protein
VTLALLALFAVPRPAMPCCGAQPGAPPASISLADCCTTEMKLACPVIRPAVAPASALPAASGAASPALCESVATLFPSPVSRAAERAPALSPGGNFSGFARPLLL